MCAVRGVPCGVMRPTAAAGVFIDKSGDLELDHDIEVCAYGLSGWGWGRWPRAARLRCHQGWGGRHTPGPVAMPVHTWLQRSQACGAC
jgi:hypothetical protein